MFKSLQQRLPPNEILESMDLFQIKRRHSLNVSLQHQKSDNTNAPDLQTFEDFQATELVKNLLKENLKEFVVS